MRDAASTIKTRHLSPERASPEDVARLSDSLSNDVFFRELADACPVSLVALNEHRQIVYANEAMRGLISAAGGGEFNGLRPGEALRCAHMSDEPGGGGTAEACRYCGVACAAQAAISGQRERMEASVILENGEAIECRVTARPFDFKGEKIVLAAMEDISDRKRCEALERVFIHDLLNELGSVRGFVEMLESCPPEKIPQYSARILEICEIMIDEAQNHRFLQYAETGKLSVSNEVVGSMAAMLEVAQSMKFSKEAASRSIRLVDSSKDCKALADRRLLRRILINMIKNALEATPEGGSVWVGCGESDGQAVFTVKNDGVLSEEARSSIFKRSYSTKGKGRGVGSYGMKLFAERYLNGSVGFESSNEAGTVFWLKTPKAGS